jgi:hypothetical protein
MENILPSTYGKTAFSATLSTAQGLKWLKI